MTDRVVPGLILSLQGQNLLYIQAFDDQRRQNLTSLLEKEKWKSSIMEFGQILNRIQNLPSLLDAFQEWCKKASVSLDIICPAIRTADVLHNSFYCR